MNNDIETGAEYRKVVVICSTERVRALQWAMDVAGLIGGNFAKFEDIKDWGSIKNASQQDCGGDLVLFAEDPNSISAEIAANALKVLLVEPPFEYAERGILQGAAFTGDKRDQWVNETRSALDFFQRNRASGGVLLTHADIQGRPKDCLAALNDIGLNLPEMPEITATATDPVLHLLAQLLVDRQAQCRNLYEEVLAASSLARTDEEFHVNLEAESGTVASYMQGRVEAGCKQATLNETVASSQAELELAHLQIHQLQEELETLHLQATSKAAEKEEQPKKEPDSSEKELRAELELALLQVHQLQEELEIYYQKYLEESGKPTEVLEQFGAAAGGESLRVLRLARAMHGNVAAVR